MNVDESDDPMVIELYAQQFYWKARYGGEDNVDLISSKVVNSLSRKNVIKFILIILLFD